MERIMFTKASVHALTPPAQGQRRTVYDLKHRRLAVRITSAGVRTFYVVKRSPPTVIWIKLGVFPEMTVEQARNEAQKVQGEFASGANPATVKRAMKAEPTFADALDDYLKGKRKRDGTALADKTQRHYEVLAKDYLASIQGKKLSTIERNEIKAIHRKGSERSERQADIAVTLVSAVFSYMRDVERFTGPNPAERIKKNPAVQRDRFLQKDELPKFFQAIAVMPSPLMRDYFLMSLLTGARRSNVCSMCWEDINLEARTWRIGMTKNGTPQTVTLSPEAMEVLAARRLSTDGRGFVFPGRGVTGHIVEPKKAWANLLKAAGLEDVRIHDLRRTLGSWQAITGSSMLVIGKSLNHKTHQATAIYARLDLSPVRHSIDTATQAIMRAAAPIPPSLPRDLKEALG
jgi:integrase